MDSGENAAKFFLIVSLFCLGGILFWMKKGQGESPLSTVSPIVQKSESKEIPATGREKNGLTKEIDGESCYQYAGDSRWFYSSKEGVEMVWDEGLKCFRIDGRDEKGGRFARNPDGKVFEQKNGKWIYHHALTGIDWRIDPRGHYDLQEHHGKHLTESGRVIQSTFRGWMVDDGPKLGKRRLQWGVDVEGYYLRSAFKRDGYEGVVLPNGLELRWKENDPKSLEYLDEVRSASDSTWTPQPAGQLSHLWKTDPVRLYKRLVEEEETIPEWTAVLQSLQGEGNRNSFKAEIEKTFGIVIHESEAKRYAPLLLACIALTLDCYPRGMVPHFLKTIECVPVQAEWAGRAHSQQKLVEVAAPHGDGAYQTHSLLSTLHHEFAHHITLVAELGFDWGGFRALHPNFRYGNQYLAEKGGVKEVMDTARDYGLTNEYEDVATITEFFMTDPSDLSEKKSDCFKKKYAYLTKFYNERFGFHLNPDYMNNRLFEASLYHWVAVSSVVQDLPSMRLQ